MIVTQFTDLICRLAWLKQISDDNREKEAVIKTLKSQIIYQKLSIILKICQVYVGRLISSSSNLGLGQSIVLSKYCTVDSLWSSRHKLALLNIYWRHNFQAPALPTVTYLPPVRPDQGGLGLQLNLATFMSITSTDIDYWEHIYCVLWITQRTWNTFFLHILLSQGFDWEGLSTRALTPPIAPKVQSTADTSNFDK